jgi:regulatory protein
LIVKEAKNKAARYCAYQERTQQEVRDKLFKLGLYSEEVENIILELIEDGFINEERYAKAYVRGKFYQNKWGKLKIQYGLKQKGLSNYCIDKGLSEIRDAEYTEMALKLINKKHEELNINDAYIRNNKIAAFLYAKGFEKDFIWKLLKK